jgi:hypothetical protein
LVDHVTQPNDRAVSELSLANGIGASRDKEVSGVGGMEEEKSRYSEVDKNRDGKVKKTYLRVSIGDILVNC